MFIYQRVNVSRLPHNAPLGLRRAPSPLAALRHRERRGGARGEPLRWWGMPSCGELWSDPFLHSKCIMYKIYIYIYPNIYIYVIIIRILYIKNQFTSVHINSHHGHYSAKHKKKWFRFALNQSWLPLLVKHRPKNEPYLTSRSPTCRGGSSTLRNMEKYAKVCQEMSGSWPEKGWHVLRCVDILNYIISIYQQVITSCQHGIWCQDNINIPTWSNMFQIFQLNPPQIVYAIRVSAWFRRYPWKPASLSRNVPKMIWLWVKTLVPGWYPKLVYGCLFPNNKVIL